MHSGSSGALQQFEHDQGLLALAAHFRSNTVADARRRGIDAFDPAHHAHALVQVDQAQIDIPAGLRRAAHQDRKSVVKGKSESVSVDLGGRRSIKKKKKKEERRSRHIQRHTSLPSEQNNNTTQIADTTHTTT